MAGSTRAKQNGGTGRASASRNGAGPGGRRLVIVESPAKARKIASFLGSNFVVESSRGHIRDLPRGAADVPAKYKGQSWARLGVDVENDFEPLYLVTQDKKSTVSELKDALKNVDELYLATDGDREGEAIAWHLMETLKPKVPVRRMVFHEITESAIQAAAANPRDLDHDLVDAQETRRILDRLYGYEVSPVLWKKVMPKLSAGRVQSVATRIVVERERERIRFVPASYWDISATMDAGADADPRRFGARLVSVDGAKVATGRDFGPDGQLKNADARVLSEDDEVADPFGGDLDDETALERAGMPAADAAALVELAEDRRGGGQFGVSRGPVRAPTLVTWFDTGRGRYLMTTENAWISIAPADDARIAQRLADVLSAA